jgi:PAS domain S-box-containing protein
MAGRFRDIPIRKKLTLAILVTSTTALFAAAIAIMAYEWVTYRQRAAQETATLAEIIGSNLTGALAFSDQKGAEETLAKLQDEPNIIAARIYTDDGVPFATYVRPGFEDTIVPLGPEIREAEFTRGSLRLFRDIVLRGDRLGAIFVETSLSTMYARLFRYAGIITTVTLVLSAVVLFLSIRIKRFISDPILALAAAARRVTEENDFRSRASVTSDDEVGLLTRAFNQMLETISERDEALIKSNRVLQEEIQERKKTARELNKSTEHLGLAQKAGHIGSFDWNLATNAIEWTDELESIYGLAPGGFSGRYESWISFIYPDDRSRMEAALSEAIDGESELAIEHRIFLPAGDVRWIAVRGRAFYDEAGVPTRFIGVNIDITDRKIAETKLIEQSEALWRSNLELEQFAYVSSHDLQEPLRKIANYAQILQRRFQSQLGEDGDRYIESIVSGVDHMHTLIQDLLIYSRSGKEELKMEPVNMNTLTQSVQSNMESSIQEAGAVVKAGSLPTVPAHAGQMHQLLQNLIANAIKFRGPRSPVVEIGAEEDEGNWRFFVRDNGIGIAPEYRDQIFKIFQRLHNRSEYPGTGIGLAICRKIVERHGGKIWVESEVGKGSTFYFTLAPVAALIKGA